MIYLNDNIILPNLLGINSSEYNIVLKNNVTNVEYEYVAQNESTNDLYYSFNIDTSSLPNNEYTISISTVGENTITDVLTNVVIGAKENVYSNWKRTINNTLYVGYSAGGYNSIQLRTKGTSSGIVTKVSDGIIKKITVEWNEHTTNNRQLDVYGKNEAYFDPNELYDFSTKGELLGSIKFNESNELVVEGNYKYIGLRSKENALYLDSIKVEWTPYISVGSFIAQKGIDDKVKRTSFDNDTQYIQFEN